MSVQVSVEAGVLVHGRSLDWLQFDGQLWQQIALPPMREPSQPLVTIPPHCWHGPAMQAKPAWQNPASELPQGAVW